MRRYIVLARNSLFAARQAKAEFDALTRSSNTGRQSICKVLKSAGDDGPWLVEMNAETAATVNAPDSLLRADEEQYNRHPRAP